MPKFLERQAQQGKQQHLRGASMTQAPPASKLVGSHAFLSHQYNAVVQQQNGEQTNEQKQIKPAETQPKKADKTKKKSKATAAASTHSAPQARRTSGLSRA